MTIEYDANCEDTAIDLTPVTLAVTDAKEAALAAETAAGDAKSAAESAESAITAAAGDITDVKASADGAKASADDAKAAAESADTAAGLAKTGADDAYAEAALAKSAIDTAALEIDKISKADSGGMSATPDSLAYEIGEIAGHLHHYERRVGLAAAASGETHVCDRLGNTTAPFVLTSGNNAYGNWVQLVGSSDLNSVVYPLGGKYLYDPNTVVVTATSSTSAVYVIQIAGGTSGAAALSADTVSEILFKAESSPFRSLTLLCTSDVHAASTKLWARCLCQNQNAATVSFFLGLHAYG